MSIYHHIHHIIPKHMGGTDDPSNLVKVTLEQHINLHKQLWEDLGDIRDFYAWKGLEGRLSKEDRIRLRCSLGGKLGGKKLLGIPKSESHRQALSLSNMGKPLAKDRIDKIKYSLSGDRSNLSKRYKITDPLGVVHYVQGLNEFCRDNKLSQGNMCMVANGQRKQHKGWRCELL